MAKQKGNTKKQRPGGKVKRVRRKIGRNNPFAGLPRMERLLSKAILRFKGRLAAEVLTP